MRRVRIVRASLLGALPLVASLLHCGGDDTVVPLPGADAGADVTLRPDGGGDTGSANDTGTANDTGADVTNDVAAPDAGDAAPDGSTVQSFTIEREEPGATGAPNVVAGQRERAILRWSQPGASTVQITGAGPVIAVVKDGPTVLDDFANATRVAATAPELKFGTYLFLTTITAKLPNGATIFGDAWSDVLISPRGIISRGNAVGSSGIGETNTAIPIPVATIPSQWRDGTLAPFWDARLGATGAGSRITTGVFDANGAEERLVVEWSDMTTTIYGTGRKIPAHVTFQCAIYRDGRVAFRYKAPVIDGTPLDQDAPALAGQQQSIGVASSDGTTVAIPLSVRRASLPPTGATYLFLPSAKLPATGVAIVPLAAQAGVQTFTLPGGGADGGSAMVTAAVEPMYTVAKTSDSVAIRDISADPNAQPVTIDPQGTVAPLPLKFALDAFHEGWRGLAISNSASVAPLGAAGLTALTVGSNLPDPAVPNGFLPIFRNLSGSDWYESTSPSAWTLVEGAAPSRKVTVYFKQVSPSSSSTSKLDLETVVNENGDIEYHYGNLSTTTDPAILGAGLLAGIENGNGDVGLLVPRDANGNVVDATKPSTHVLFKRHK